MLARLQYRNETKQVAVVVESEIESSSSCDGQQRNRYAEYTLPQPAHDEREKLILVALTTAEKRKESTWSLFSSSDLEVKPARPKRGGHFEFA